MLVHRKRKVEELEDFVKSASVNGDEFTLHEVCGAGCVERSAKPGVHDAWVGVSPSRGLCGWMRDVRVRWPAGTPEIWVLSTVDYLEGASGRGKQQSISAVACTSLEGDQTCSLPVRLLR